MPKKRVGTQAADLNAYSAGKNEMVPRILLAAGPSEAERASIGANEVPVTDRKQ